MSYSINFSTESLPLAIASFKKKRCTLLTEGTDIHIWYHNHRKDLKFLPAIIFLCLGNTSIVHDCNIIALSLVLLVSTFDMVIVKLRKTKTKNSTMLWCLVIIVGVVANNTSISAV